MKTTYIERHRIEMLKQNIKKNNTVFVVPNDSRWSSFTAKILRVGRVYITVDDIYKGDNRFTIGNFENICSDYIPKYTLYASKEDYELCNTMKQEIDHLTAEIKIGLQYISPNILQKILEIVNDNLIC